MNTFVAKTCIGVMLAALAAMPLALHAQSLQSDPHTAVPSAVPTANPATRPQIRTLANGLKVAVVEDHSAAVVQTGVWYRFGALDETPGRTGLAHGLEHMMFRGTPSISEGGLDDIAARLGAQENANTANEYTHFYFVMPSSKLDLALKIEADRMRNLSLGGSDWQLEKGAVLSEYDGDLGSPTTRLINDTCLAATTVPLCGLGALGARSDIVRSRAVDLAHYYNTYYHPQNATLVIVGDVRAADAFADAQRAFGAIPAREFMRRQHGIPHFATGKSLKEQGDYPYVVSDVAYPFSGDNDPDAGAATIIDAVINDQRSPFYTNLILSGIALSYETSASSNLHGGIEHIITVLAPGHTANEAVASFTSTMNKMLKDGISPDLIAAAKRANAVNAIYARDSISGLGDRVGYALGVEGRRDPTEDDVTVANTSVAQVEAYARKVFAQPSVSSVLTPQHPKPGAKEPTTGAAISDNFASRAPSGPIVEAPWVTKALAAPVRIESRVKPTRYTLSNGIHVLVQPVHENPTIFVSGSIENSPFFEPFGQAGIRGVASALLGYGSTRYDFEAQRRISDELGANIDLGADFGAHGLAKDLPQILDVLADGEEHPLFAPKYIDLIKTQELAGIASRAGNPEYQTGRAFERLLYANSDPSLRESSLASIRAIRPEDLHAYASKYLRPDLTTIAVVGDIEPQAARDAIERAFGAWRNIGPKPKIVYDALPNPSGKSARVLANRKLVSVHLGEPAIARNSPDFAAFNLLNAIIGAGGSFDTRLMHEIRERRGLVYSVSSALQAGKYRGIFTVSLSANPANVAPAVALAKQQLVLLTQKAPSQAELDRARQRLIAGSLVDEESTESIVERLDTIGGYNLPADYYATLSRRYGGITPARILAVARKYLHPEKLVAVYQGP